MKLPLAASILFCSIPFLNHVACAATATTPQQNKKQRSGPTPQQQKQHQPQSDDDEELCNKTASLSTSPGTYTVDDIFGGDGNNKDWINEDVYSFLTDLQGDDDATDGMLGAIKEYLDGLLTSSDATLRATFDEKQLKLAQIINKSKLPEKEIALWMTTLSEALSSSTEVFIWKNYVPHTDCKVLKDDKHTPIEDIINRLPRNNSCVQKFNYNLIDSIAREFNGLSEDEDRKKVPHTINGRDHKGVAFVDACSVVLNKGYYLQHIDMFIDVSNFKSRAEFYALALISSGYHARFYRMRTGQPLPAMAATANGHNNLLNKKKKFDVEGTVVNKFFMIYPRVPHGECWSNKSYLLQYTEDECKVFGKILANFYSNLKGYEHLKGFDSEVALRYAGYKWMTPEEKENLILNREWFFRAPTLAKAMSETGWTREGLEGLSDSFITKNGLTGEDLVAMYNRFLNIKEDTHDVLVDDLKVVRDNARMITLASVMFGGDEPKTRDQLDDDMGGLYDRLFDVSEFKRRKSYEAFNAKLEGMYLGSVRGGNWAKLASIMFSGPEDLPRDQLDNDMRDLYDELHGCSKLLHKSFVEKLRGVYLGNVRGGNWAKLASVMFGGHEDLPRQQLDSDMRDLYDELRGSCLSLTDDAFVEKLRGVYLGSVRGGNWAKLASVMFGGPEDLSRDQLNDDMRDLYDELLKSSKLLEKSFVAKLSGVYDGCKKGGTTTFLLRKGCFAWLDGFDDLLLNIFQSDENSSTLSDADKEKYARFEHVIDASKLLAQEISEDNRQVVFDDINNIFSNGDQDMGFDNNDGQLGERWSAFFDRYTHDPKLKADPNISSKIRHLQTCYSIAVRGNFAEGNARSAGHLRAVDTDLPGHTVPEQTTDNGMW